MTVRLPVRATGRVPVVRTAVFAVVLTATIGCNVTGTKAGSERPATVLRLATAELRGVPYTPDVERFADRVAELTDGSVRVELDYEAVPWSPSSEQRLTTLVRDGDTELALVSPRVFDTIDIHGFEALQTPFLIDTPELAGAVATSPTAEDMLARLSRHQLVGLSLVYEGLRRPVALNGAVTRAADLDGLTVRVPTSDLSDRIFRALGAIPDRGASHTIATTGRPYALVETELGLADTDFPTGSVATANVVFFPKYNVLLANPDALARLDDDEEEAVRRAAAETAVAAAQTTEDEQRLAEAYCEVGGEMVLALDGELDRLRSLVAPVVDELQKDPATAEAIASIEALGSATSAPELVIPPACLPPTGDGAQLPSEPVAPTP